MNAINNNNNNKGKVGVVALCDPSRFSTDTEDDAIKTMLDPLEPFLTTNRLCLKCGVWYKPFHCRGRMQCKNTGNDHVFSFDSVYNPGKYPVVACPLFWLEGNGYTDYRGVAELVVDKTTRLSSGTGRMERVYNKLLRAIDYTGDSSSAVIAEGTEEERIEERHRRAERDAHRKDANALESLYEDASKRLKERLRKKRRLANPDADLEDDAEQQQQQEDETLKYPFAVFVVSSSVDRSSLFD